MHPTATRSVRHNAAHSAVLLGLGLACAGARASGVLVTPPPGQAVGALSFVQINQNDPNPGLFLTDGDPPGVTSTSPAYFAGGVANNQASASSSLAGAAAGGTAQVRASADLATGTLKVYANSTGTYFSQSLQQDIPSLVAVSQAALEETLTPQASGVLHLRFQLDGTLASGATPFSGASLGMQFRVNGAVLYGASGEPSILADNTGAWAPGCALAGTALSCNLSAANGFTQADVNVTAGTPVDFTLVLEADAADGTADFEHTLHIAASGVPWTSASGLFLTQVPVPPAAWLLPSALAALGARRRRPTAR